jgi:hypothetical protein
MSRKYVKSPPEFRQKRYDNEMITGYKGLKNGEFLFNIKRTYRGCPLTDNYTGILRYIPGCSGDSIPMIFSMYADKFYGIGFNVEVGELLVFENELNMIDVMDICDQCLSNDPIALYLRDKGYITTEKFNKQYPKVEAV